MNMEYESLIPSFVHIINRHCDESYFIPPSLRSFHNFMFIMSGEGYCVKDRLSQPITGPALIYNPPGQRFGYRTSKACPMHIFGVNVHLAYASVYAGRWRLEDSAALALPHMMKLEEPKMLLKQLEQLAVCWNDSKIDYNMQCRSIFLTILLQLLRLTTKGNHDPAEQLIKPATRYIHQYYMEEITLQQLCKEVGLTPSYFGRVFKKVTGVSPITYVHKVRIDKAKELLAIGFNVTEIAEMVGFQDPFYFSKVFKRIEGVSPRVYKNGNIDLL